MGTVAMRLSQFQRYFSCDPGTGLHICDLGMELHNKVLPSVTKELFAIHLRSSSCNALCISHSVMSDSLQPHRLYIPPGSTVHGLLQATVLECVAIPLSRVSS